MTRIDCALDPGAACPNAVTIVVDCIRASTVIVQALDAGYERVICVDSIEEARAIAAAEAGAVLGGERGGLRIEDFALGNSPDEYRRPLGPLLVLTTTNGTRAIVRAAAESATVFVGALVNLASVSAAALAAGSEGGIGIRCAGVAGEVAYDDAYVAGRLVEEMASLGSTLEPTDAARVALAIAAGEPDARAALAASSSARALRDVGHGDDVSLCARESVLNTVPVVVASSPSSAELRSSGGSG